MSTRMKVLAFIAGAAMPCLLSVAVSAEETFTKTIINMPLVGTTQQQLNSFDISFVDADISKYILADRSNKSLDVVDTVTNTFVRELTGCGGNVSFPSCSVFVGVQSGSNTSGPNGALIVDHREAWGPDGVSTSSPTSKVHVINIADNTLIASIDTGGSKRADELCEDVAHETVVVANDDTADNFITFISTETYTKIGSAISFKGTDPNGKITLTTSPPTPSTAKVAANGIEQCKFDPRTKQFYLAIPATTITQGSTTSDGPGVVLVISRDAPFHVERTITIDPSTECGPAGLVVGPDHQILLDCTNPTPNSLIIDENQHGAATPANSTVLADTGKGDEAWYNPGDNQYYVTQSNHTPPQLGVVDPSGMIDTPITTATGSHSVAADMLTNNIYVPGNKGATTLCGGGNGCIAVFHSNNDDGCLSKGMPVLDGDDGDDPVFMRTACGHDNQGHEGNQADKD